MYCRVVARLVGGCIALALSVASSSAAVLSIGHRGNSLFALENTLASCFAAQGKADYVEIDVRLSSDGQLVLMHDATVDRTTDGTGAVSGQTIAQLKSLDAGSWFSASFVGERIPLMAEMVTNTLPFAVPLIEHKTGSASAYVSELQRLGAITNIVLQSFDWNFLAAVHAIEPNIKLCALGSGALDAASLTTITNTGARTVAWEKASVTPALVSLVHDWGMALFVWTVDNSAEIQNFINLGVDGIISNDPASVKGLQPPPTTNAQSPDARAPQTPMAWAVLEVSNTVPTVEMAQTKTKWMDLMGCLDSFLVVPHRASWGPGHFAL